MSERYIVKPRTGYSLSMGSGSMRKYTYWTVYDTVAQEVVHEYAKQKHAELRARIFNSAARQQGAR